MKRFKVLALAAMMIGSVTAFATKHEVSKFKQNYSNSGTKASPIWTLNNRVEGPLPNQYSCDPADNYCTANFASAPSPGQIPTDFETGVFSVN
jgi:hypothetical protein